MSRAESTQATANKARKTSHYHQRVASKYHLPQRSPTKQYAQYLPAIRARQAWDANIGEASARHGPSSRGPSTAAYVIVDDGHHVSDTSGGSFASNSGARLWKKRAYAKRAKYIRADANINNAIYAVCTELFFSRGDEFNMLLMRWLICAFMKFQRVNCIYTRFSIGSRNHLWIVNYWSNRCGNSSWAYNSTVQCVTQHVLLLKFHGLEWIYRFLMIPFRFSVIIY